MQLSVGDRLGPYEIVASLGEGGMGQVYRARDTRLQREVAVKVSSEQFSERFAREAQLIASLNHPNICTLFDVGPNYLVMELIEGPTLYDRMAQGAMPLEEAVPVAVQIAEALEAAHDKGIVHRDLKPANIKLTADGKVKVLDFGLAKALEGDASGAPSLANSPTLAPTRVAATQAGFILGTAGYMAPEQARGHAVDRRADIFAYGVVLWEMVTGKRMFEGETVSDTLAQILTQTPVVDAAPAALRPLLARCLEKDRKKRLQAIGEARIALESPSSAVVEVRAGRRLLWPVIAAVLGVALVACVFALYRATRTVDRPMVMLDADMGVPLAATFSAGASVVLSPDGTRVAFLDSGRKLYARRLDETKVTLLSASPVQGPFFSPDGKWIGYFSENHLRKVLATGGTAINIRPIVVEGNSRGAAWLRDGTIVASLGANEGLMRIPDAGGEAKAVTKLDGNRKEVTHRFPHALPGHKAVVFTASMSQTNFDEAQVEAVDLSSGARKTLVRGGYYGRYLASGHLVYLNNRNLFAVPFDASALEVKGSPAPVLENVFSQGNIGYGHFDASEEGTAAYRMRRELRTSFRWLDAAGKAGATVLEDNAGNPRLSVDGKKIVYTKNGSVWIQDTANGQASRLTYGNSSSPVFSADGNCVAYRVESKIACVRADGAGKPETLVEGFIPETFSPDGNHLLMSPGPTGLWIATLGKTDTGLRATRTTPLFPDDPSAQTPDFSPDGKWIAYRATTTGAREVFVRAFPDTGAKYQISSASGQSPVWSREGKELFWFDMQGRIFATAYTTQGNVFVPGKTRMVTDVVANPTRDRGLAAAPGGRLLVATLDAQLEADTKVVFLFHFFDELKRRLAGAGVRAE